MWATILIIYLVSNCFKMHLFLRIYLIGYLHWLFIGLDIYIYIGYSFYSHIFLERNLQTLIHT